MMGAGLGAGCLGAGERSRLGVGAAGRSGRCVGAGVTGQGLWMTGGRIVLETRGLDRGLAGGGVT